MDAVASSLIAGGVARHDDDGFRVQRPCGISHSLRMVATGVSDHAPSPLLFRQRGDLVIGPAKLERADGLKIFELQKQTTSVTGSYVAETHFQEWRPDSDVVQASLRL